MSDEPEDDVETDETDEPDETGAGGLDLDGLLGQVQSMQQQLMDTQAKLAETEVEGQAGGGAVKVSVTGNFEFRSVTIDPAAVDPDDVEMLQDLVLAAIRDAIAQVNALGRDALGGMPGFFGS